MNLEQSIHLLFPSVLSNQLEKFILTNLYCLLFAFLLTCLGLPLLIKVFKTKKTGQVIRDDGPKRHLKKAGTPVMGGVVMILAVFITTLVYVDLSVPEVWIGLCTLIGFGLIGFIDDFFKINVKHRKGLSSRAKLILQTILGVVLITWLYCLHPNILNHQIYLPFFPDIKFTLGIFYLLLIYIMLIGTSNAVNLTDGLDGLAIFPSILVFLGLVWAAFITIYIGTRASNLLSPYTVEQISFMSSALMGAGLAFLWFNCYPARIFMGDSGSLALGATMGLFAALLQQELLLILLGGVFVLETLSVIIQVGYFRMTKKRIFKMAPLHHHFELLGWSETTVIIRFWIIASLCLVLSGIAMNY